MDRSGMNTGVAGSALARPFAVVQVETKEVEKTAAIETDTVTLRVDKGDSPNVDRGGVQ